MTPGAARVFFIAGISIIVGALIGAYATRAVYGDEIEAVDPSPEVQLVCPPCPDCPTCPPPPDCGGLAAPTGKAPEAILVPESEEIIEEEPGLPGRAILLAVEAVQKAVKPCTHDGRGVLILSLTVTSTGGQGFISEALVADRDNIDPDSETETCVVDGAKSARFEWTEGDGQQTMIHPVRIGN